MKRKKEVKGKRKNKTKQYQLNNSQLCHLKARFFALSAEAALGDPNYDNGYRKIGTKTAQIISSNIVLQYLESRNLLLTLETAKTESSNDLSRTLEDLWIARKLQVRGRRDVIHGILQSIKYSELPVKPISPTKQVTKPITNINPNQLIKSTGKKPQPIQTPPPNLIIEKPKPDSPTKNKPKKNPKSKVKSQKPEPLGFKITANLISPQEIPETQAPKPPKRKKAKKKSTKKEIIELNESLISPIQNLAPSPVEKNPEPKRSTKSQNKKGKKASKSKPNSDNERNFFINYDQMHSSDDQDNDDININLDELPPPLGTDSSDEYDDDNEERVFDSLNEYRYTNTTMQPDMHHYDDDRIEDTNKRMKSNNHKLKSHNQYDEEQEQQSQKRKHLNDPSHFYTYTYEAEEDIIENRSDSTQYEYPTHIYEYEDYDEDEEDVNKSSRISDQKNDDNIAFSPIVGNSLITGEIEINSQDLLNSLSTEIDDSKPIGFLNSEQNLPESIERNNKIRRNLSLEHNVEINQRKPEPNQINDNSILPPNKVLLVFQTFHKVDVEPDNEQQRLFKLQKGKISSSSDPSPTQQNPTPLSPEVVKVVEVKEIKEDKVDKNDYVVHVKIVEAEISTESKFKSNDFKVQIKLGSAEEFAETQRSSPSIKTIYNSKGSQGNANNFSVVYYSWNETFTIFCNNIDKEKIVVSTLSSNSRDDSFEIVSIAMIPTKSFKVGDISDVWVNMKNTGRLHLLICLGYFEGEEEEEEEFIEEEEEDI